MERKRAKSFEQTYVIEGDEADRLDEQSMTAVLGELASAMEPPARDPGYGPDSGDTVTMNVLVATSVDEMLLKADDESSPTAELLAPEMLRSPEDDEIEAD